MSPNISEIKDIKSILQKHFKADIEIVEIESKPLTAPGENYGSVILAINTKIRVGKKDTELMHFVAKLLPANEFLCQIFNIQETFKKELNFYAHVIPTLEKFHEEISAKNGNISELFAKYFGGRISLKPGSDKVDEDALLLLENLKIYGYDVADRLIGFDLEHAKLVLENLARFHAVPIAMRILKPDAFKEHVLPGIKGVKTGVSENNIANQIMSDILDFLKSVQEFESSVLAKIGDSIIFNFTGQVKLLEAREPFCTLIHSDFWVNNIMILRNEAGKPVRVKIVDLQLPMHNSFAFDLLLFLYTSIVPEILQENFDHFIKHYYNSFTRCLEEFNLNIAPFSWDNFMGEIATVAPIVLGQILFMLKPILADRGQIKDMSKFDKDSFAKEKGANPVYEARLLATTKSYLKNKWI